MEMERRRFVKTCLASAGSALLLGGFSATAVAAEEDEISAAEDTMREHAVLGRILIAYDETANSIEDGEPVPADAIADAAELVDEFIIVYHEAKEEDDIFPRLRAAGRHVELVDELERQHHLSRVLTDRILRNARMPVTPPKSRALVRDMRRYARMYRAHAAYEDTVVLPALQEIMTAEEYAALGEAFEEHEHELFGEDPFGSILRRVEQIERSLGVHGVARFARA